MVNKVNNRSFTGMFLAESGLKDGKQMLAKTQSVLIKQNKKMLRHIPVVVYIVVIVSKKC